RSTTARVTTRTTSRETVTARPMERGEAFTPRDSLDSLRCRSWVRMSRPVPDEPDQEGDRERHGRVDDERGLQLRRDPRAGEELVGHRGRDDAEEHAEHPGGEEGPEDVEGRAVHGSSGGVHLPGQALTRSASPERC